LVTIISPGPVPKCWTSALISFSTHVIWLQLTAVIVSGRAPAAAPS
jgi:hypothetical protein